MPHIVIKTHRQTLISQASPSTLTHRLVLGEDGYDIEIELDGACAQSCTLRGVTTLEQTAQAWFERLTAGAVPPCDGTGGAG